MFSKFFVSYVIAEPEKLLEPGSQEGVKMTPHNLIKNGAKTSVGLTGVYL